MNGSYFTNRTVMAVCDIPESADWLLEALGLHACAASEVGFNLSGIRLPACAHQATPVKTLTHSRNLRRAGKQPSVLCCVCFCFQPKQSVSPCSPKTEGLSWRGEWQTATVVPPCVCTPASRLDYNKAVYAT